MLGIQPDVRVEDVWKEGDVMPRLAQKMVGAPSPTFGMRRAPSRIHV